MDISTKDWSIKYLYLYKMNWYMIKWFYTFSMYKKVTECMLNVFFIISALFIPSSGQVSDSCWCSPPPAPCRKAPAGSAGTWVAPHTSFPPLFSELEDTTSLISNIRNFIISSITFAEDVDDPIHVPVAVVSQCDRIRHDCRLELFACKFTSADWEKSSLL